MSLFENEEYQWRETFFILFQEENQPTTQRIEQVLRALDARFVLRDVKSDEAGRFESLTLESPDDYSAMDISLVRGDEVVEQTNEIKPELLKCAVGNKEKLLINSLSEFRCRYDIYHFEHSVFV